PGGRRELHSFPTRRSSDLEEIVFQQGQDKDQGKDDKTKEKGNPFPWTAVNNRIVCQHSEYDDQPDPTGVLFGKDGNENKKGTKEDRKSTRLNSSHVKISYA